MAFLDNSGDIILDAVLTDTGRMRLAKGDGSFSITKFAFGDDEINYKLYDKNHASGSAYYDIEILQTPVLEAFTNNTSLLKSKLLSISRTNLLYLPVIRRNTTQGIANNANTNMITVLADENSWDTSPAGSDITGDLVQSTAPIVLDQGIESNAIGSGQYVPLDADLVETQYIIEMDNRLGYIASPAGIAATPSFIDDDNIASYYFSTSTNTDYFGTVGDTVIKGPRGTRLLFLVGPSTDLASSTYLFNQLGGDGTIDSVNVKQIDTTVRITGATTGYRVDLPIRIVKKNA
jgi:hypothetical protein